MNAARLGGWSDLQPRSSAARACSSARSMRPQALRVASHSSTRRTWQISRTSRAVTAPDDGAAVGQQVDDADAGQGDQRLADGRVADAEALGQLLRDQVLPGAQPALEDVGQERLHHDCLHRPWFPGRGFQFGSCQGRSPNGYRVSIKMGEPAGLM